MGHADIDFGGLESNESNSHTSSQRSAGSEADIVGSVFHEHYQIVEPLGSGGMSTVFKARHLLLDRDVAIKLLLPNVSDKEKSIMRFQQEAKAAADLQHQNICSVREFGIDQGRPFLVMDYVEGESLADMIANHGSVEPDRAIEIVTQICEGLSYAHSRNIIHRDVKPANILLEVDQSGTARAKIVDFGIAKILREDQSGPNLTQTGEVFGTPMYMSPEQCRGEKIDVRTDIYSIGCVLYELLAGKPAFRGESTVETLLKHINEAPPKLSGSGVHSEMNAVVQCCLSKNPDDRYRSIEDLSRDLTLVKENRSAEKARELGSASKQILKRRLDAWYYDTFILWGFAVALGVITQSELGRLLYIGLFEQIVPGNLFLCGGVPKDSVSSALYLLGFNFLYHVLSESSKAQATIGKRLTSLIVCDNRGGKLPFWRLGIRHAMKSVVASLFVVVGAVFLEVLGMIFGFRFSQILKSNPGFYTMLFAIACIVPATVLSAWLLRSRYQMVHDILPRCFVKSREDDLPPPEKKIEPKR